MTTDAIDDVLNTEAGGDAHQVEQGVVSVDTEVSPTFVQFFHPYQTAPDSEMFLI